MQKNLKAVVKIQGGLGNQLFAYAFGQKLIKEGLEVYYDISHYATYYMPYVLYKFNVDVNLCDTILKVKKKNLLNRILKRFCKNYNPYKNFAYYKEKGHLYDSNVFNIKHDTYFDGYWGSEKYWNEMKPEIFNQFTLKHNLDNDSLEYLNKIESCKNSVALHIRRGDKAFMKSINTVLGLDSLDYYYQAMGVIEDKLNDVTYFVVSDDMPYVKKNLKINKNVVMMIFEIGS